MSGQTTIFGWLEDGQQSIQYQQLPANIVKYSLPSTDNRLVRAFGTGGVVEDSAITCDDSGNLSGVGTINTKSLTNLTENAGTSTDNAICRFDGATGKIIQNSGVTIDDSNNISGVMSLTCSNISSNSGTFNFDTANSANANISLRLGTGTQGRYLKIGTDGTSAFANMAFNINNSGNSYNWFVNGRINSIGTISRFDTTKDYWRLIYDGNGSARYMTLQTGQDANGADRRTHYKVDLSVDNQLIVPHGVRTSRLTAITTDTIGDGNTALWSVPLAGSAPSTGQVLTYDGTNAIWSTNASGDVSNAGASTDNAICRFDGTTGKIIQNSGITIDDSNNISGVGTLNSRIISTFVSGPPSSANRAIARFDGTTGKIILDSGVTLDDTSNLIGVSSVQAVGANASLILAPTGTGFLATSTSGNARGAGSTDLQRTRTTDTQVASGSYSTISGGRSNTASATDSFVGGGNGNASTSLNAVIVGGTANTSGANYSFVGNGAGNSASSLHSAILSGASNSIGAGVPCAIILGGNNNSISAGGVYSIVLGGQYNNIQHAGCVAYSTNLSGCNSSANDQVILNLDGTSYTPPASAGFFFNGAVMYCNSGVLLPTSGGTASTLDYYESGTHSTSWSGAIPSTSGNISFTRIGNSVTLRIPQFSAVATSTSTISNTVVLPARLRPTVSIAFTIQVRNGANPSLGHCIINNAGTLTMWAGLSGSDNFVNGNTAGLFNSFAITYILV